MCCLFFSYDFRIIYLSSPLSLFLWTELKWAWVTATEIWQRNRSKLVLFYHRHQKYKKSVFQGLKKKKKLNIFLFAKDWVFAFCRLWNSCFGGKQKNFERVKGGRLFSIEQNSSRIFFLLFKTKIGRYCSVSKQHIQFEHKKIICFGDVVRKILGNGSSL